MAYGIAVITTLQRASDAALIEDLWDTLVAHLPGQEDALRAVLESALAVESRMPVGTVLLLFGVHADTRVLLLFDTICKVQERAAAAAHLAERARCDPRWLQKALVPGVFQRAQPFAAVRLGR